jgi:hypothetical protein
MGLMFITSKTAPGDADSGALRFADGEDGVVFDNTYNEYQFYFVNMHPQNYSNFQFQVNDTDDPGGGFDVSLITSTHFRTYHKEDDSETHLGYSDGHDLAQEAEYQIMANNVDNVADNGCSGVLTIYDPSSITYVKHFISTLQSQHTTTYSQQSFTAGYINDTTAIDEINFKFSGGNIDAGTIYMYGVG